MLILAVDPRGKVTVGGSDMGCIGLGLFSAGPLATIKNVDITFKSCTYDGYNRRFGGTMLFEDGGRRVKLQLQASNIRIGSKVAFYELKGTLSR
ncbi:MAG: hypothetical protein O9339_19340 [Rubrivivax sp.]|nr:hypothetical protein [Rubrivivax sp.]